MSPRGCLQNTIQPHQNSNMTLERVASHMKLTCPLLIPVAAVGKCTN